MNYLAHIFLSGDNEEIIIGNFIGDYVKGQDFKKYSETIRKGIILHRNIDSFTDRNEIIIKTKSLLSKKYGKYSGIIVDIFYDHFLTKNWHIFSGQSLDYYIDNIHKVLLKYSEILPEKVKQFLPSFIDNNWIRTYKSIKGIKIVLLRMSRNTTLPDETDYAINILKSYYNDIETSFLNYFPELIKFVNKKFEISIKY
jgi:acyl carrier protein phosphodiesterase